MPFSIEIVFSSASTLQISTSKKKKKSHLPSQCIVFSFNGGGKEILEEDVPGFLCSGRWKIQQLPSAAVQILNKAKVPSQG